MWWLLACATMTAESFDTGTCDPDVAVPAFRASLGEWTDTHGDCREDADCAATEDPSGCDWVAVRADAMTATEAEIARLLDASPCVESDAMCFAGMPYAACRECRCVALGSQDPDDTSVRCAE